MPDEQTVFDEMVEHVQLGAARQREPTIPCLPVGGGIALVIQCVAMQTSLRRSLWKEVLPMKLKRFWLDVLAAVGTVLATMALRLIDL